jgi:hypothetical protein
VRIANKRQESLGAILMFFQRMAFVVGCGCAVQLYGYL